jgi:DNA-binding NtrC family response regulator
MPKPRALRIFRDDTSVDVALDDDKRTMIGRHDAADVAFDSVEVSRIHGALSCESDRFFYQDLGSSNGTRLVHNGADTALLPLEKNALVIGDVLVIGTDACRLELLAQAPAPAHVVASEKSAAAQALEGALDVAARTPLPVFLLGGSGSGKTHNARAIHERSKLTGAFVSVNCARLPTDPTSLQSELLGHVKGSFTGALADRLGKLPAADKGTLFLDEVESLPAVAQGFLLDVLEGVGLAPLGASAAAGSARIHFRLISASKRPLAQSGLRNDLCERLAEGHMISVPSLDERRGDIPALVRAFAEEQARMLGVVVDVTPDALRVFVDAPWPGQIRQLRAAVITCSHVAIAPGVRRVAISVTDIDRHLADRAAAFRAEDADDVRAQAVAAGAIKPNPRHLTAVDVKNALARHDGNQSAAARELGIARNTLLRKMKDFDIGGAE